MNRNSILIISLAALMALPCTAQKRRAAVRKKAPVVENPKFEEMLSATQDIVFIDSTVVDKADFLNAYKMTPEAGTVSQYNKFFNTQEQPYSTVYVNQMGNKCWYSVNGGLYTSDMLNKQWSEPQPLEGLGHFQRTNYPFMLTDGLTLYFAAITDEGLGELDIYVSRYDSEAGKFLLSENLGLPFNSDANDYMYAVDEFNEIGYFATDRRQPEGKVCIYTFIPNQKRVVLNDEQISEEEMRRRAKLTSIADTWGDGKARQEALQRLTSLSTIVAKPKKKGDFTFVINDDITYSSSNDFRDPDNHDRMNELNEMRKQYDSLTAELEKQRNYYHKANSIEKNILQVQILSNERKYQQLTEGMRELEKQIRNSEIKRLKTREL